MQNTSPTARNRGPSVALKSLAVLVGLGFVAAAVHAGPRSSIETPAQKSARLAWWRDARFGMFIHWGPISLKGTEIGWSRSHEVSAAEYDNLYKRFDPTKFNAHTWVHIAKSTGMKYIVLVTKHHDGFAMWPSKVSSYNIAHTPYKKDIVRQLSDECRRQGIRFCAYYSVLDWHNPDYPLGEAPGGGVKTHPDMDRYERYMKAQLKELITSYGPLGILWFDGEWEKPWTLERGREIVNYLHTLQPSLIVNDRIGKGRIGLLGDYATPEQNIGRFNRQAPWESCITLCTQWSWKPNDTLKPLSECIQTLVTCAGGDGNLLLNVGPMPTGEIEPRQVKRLSELGAWMRQYGDTVCDTRGGPYMPSRYGVSTCRRNTVYVHVFHWPSGPLQLSPLGAKVVRARLVTGGRCAFVQSPAGIQLTVAPRDRRAIDTIVALDLNTNAERLAPVHWLATASLTAGKKATASNVYQNDSHYGAASAVDDDDTTRWATDTGTTQCWLEVDLGHAAAFNCMGVSEWAPRIHAFELLYRNDGSEPWKTAMSGTTMGADYKVTFPPVTARFVRLNILNASDGPTINEFTLQRTK